MFFYGKMINDRLPILEFMAEYFDLTLRIKLITAEKTDLVAVLHCL